MPLNDGIEVIVEESLNGVALRLAFRVSAEACEREHLQPVSVDEFAQAPTGARSVLAQAARAKLLELLPSMRLSIREAMLLAMADLLAREASQ